MEEDLEQRWQKLKLTEEEEEGITVSKETFFEGISWAPNCLLVSLLTRKNYNKEAFKGTMEKIWKATPPRKVTEVGENLFILQFHTEEDREIITNAGPWNFDDRMVLTKPLEKEDRPRKELLIKAQIWTQVYGLPFVAMTENMGRLIGAKLGKVIEVKTDEEGKGIGVCLAIRIEIDVRKQLKRRMKIAIEEDQVVFVDFKYERLSAFCYCCGIIGHNDVDCGAAIRMKKEGVANPAQYGKWLRAPARQKMVKDMGGNGKKGGQPNLNSLPKKPEMGSCSGEGNGRARGTEPVEGERGSSVITMIPVDVGRNKKNWLGLLGNSEAPHGKGKGDRCDTGKDQFSEEKREKRSEEMTWQEAREEAEKSKAGKGVNEKEKLGGEAYGLIAETKSGPKVGLTQTCRKNKSVNKENLNLIEIGTAQNKWRRLVREEEMVTESKEQGEDIKLGKRRSKEGEKGEKEDEDQGKKRKVFGEIRTNYMAEAVEQPRCAQ